MVRLDHRIQELWISSPDGHIDCHLYPQPLEMESKMNTIGIKMSNGDELIARVTDNGNYSHVYMIGMQQLPDGRVGMGMLPYITSNNDVEIAINHNLVVCTFDVDPAIEKSFLEKTSGIALG